MDTTRNDSCRGIAMQRFGTPYVCMYTHTASCITCILFYPIPSGGPAGWVRNCIPIGSQSKFTAYHHGFLLLRTISGGSNSYYYLLYYYSTTTSITYYYYPSSASTMLCNVYYGLSDVCFDDARMHHKLPDVTTI